MTSNKPLDLPLSSIGFLLGLLFSLQGGGNTFLQNIA
jgi:hypothetical protein